MSWFGSLSAATSGELTPVDRPRSSAKYISRPFLERARFGTFVGSAPHHIQECLRTHFELRHLGPEPDPRLCLLRLFRGPPLLLLSCGSRGLRLQKLIKLSLC